MNFSNKKIEYSLAYQQSGLKNNDPKLSSFYGLDKNVGYATKKHLEGIEEHGITEWHRKTFGKCKNCEKIKNIV